MVEITHDKTMTWNFFTLPITSGFMSQRVSNAEFDIFGYQSDQAAEQTI